MVNHIFVLLPSQMTEFRCTWNKIFITIDIFLTIFKSSCNPVVSLLCVHVCVCVCVCACVCVCVHVCVFMYAYTCFCLQVHMYLYMQLYAYMSTIACIIVCMPVNAFCEHVHEC